MYASVEFFENIYQQCLIAPSIPEILCTKITNEEDCNDNIECEWIGDNCAYKQLDSEIIIPIEYNLSQNYPNPFNPITTINYSIPENIYLNLSIFDIRGRKVVELYSGYRFKGIYSIQWNASRYASGLYFINIKTDNFVSTKKMTLIK